MLGLRFCVRAFSSCGKRGPLFIEVRGPLTIAAPPVAGHRLQTRRLSSCGSRAQLLHGMWDLPRPGLEPVSPALAGRFSTTAPPGMPLILTSIAVIYVFSFTVNHNTCNHKQYTWSLLDFEFYIQGIILYVFFCVMIFFLLNVMIVRVTWLFHVAVFIHFYCCKIFQWMTIW